MSEDRRSERPEQPRGEQRLAIAGVTLFAAIFLLAAGLWVRHGEEIFFSRIVTAIANCF